MPTIEENVRRWGQEYCWDQDGDEWSAPWGGVDRQWSQVILPRIGAFLPTGTILEIGPGHGRWTQYLKGLCDQLILVDVVPECIDACRRRFGENSHISYCVNDGRTLRNIPDRSVDLVFSFDALVHAEADVVQAYLGEFGRLLSANGTAFIHHSNLGECATYFTVVKRLMRGKIRHWVRELGILEIDDQWRAPSVTAQKVSDFALDAGLCCIHQEIVNWRSRHLTDCFSILCRRGSTHAGPNVVIRNDAFMKQASAILKDLPDPREVPVRGIGRWKHVALRNWRRKNRKEDCGNAGIR